MGSLHVSGGVEDEATGLHRDGLRLKNGRLGDIPGWAAMWASHDPMIASKAFSQTTSENWCHLSGCGRWRGKVGYIRTSKKDQNPDLQRKDLLAFGCEKVFEERMSSRKEDRPVLRAAMNYCREVDELVVWKLYRFGRSLRELLDLVNGLREQGVEFVSLRESIDTTTPGGKLVFHVFGAVAEFERDLSLERTMAGLEAARAREEGRQEAGDGRKEDSPGIQAHARPGDAHLGGVRGGGGI